MATPEVEARAFALMDLLLDGPKDKHDLMAASGMSRDEFKAAMRSLRNDICTEVGAVVPRPVPDDGYAYHLIDAEHHDRPAFWRGSAASTVDAETRLRSIHRDVSTYSGIVDGRTVEGRKVRLIEQRIRHLIEDLDLVDETMVPA